MRGTINGADVSMLIGRLEVVAQHRHVKLNGWVLDGVERVDVDLAAAEIRVTGDPRVWRWAGRPVVPGESG